ncbi:hypothetical protein NIES2104_37720 [Leptolyngbya sp. NIES-2104]|nr:hypothetical protein NIES2104_37720 [Leptolyngbya sp. NIES-2104]
MWRCWDYSLTVHAAFLACSSLIALIGFCSNDFSNFSHRSRNWLCAIA